MKIFYRVRTKQHEGIK